MRLRPKLQELEAAASHDRVQVILDQLESCCEKKSSIEPEVARIGEELKVQLAHLPASMSRQWWDLRGREHLPRDSKDPGSETVGTLIL